MPDKLSTKDIPHCEGILSVQPNCPTCSTETESTNNESRILTKVVWKSSSTAFLTKVVWKSSSTAFGWPIAKNRTQWYYWHFCHRIFDITNLIPSGSHRLPATSIFFPEVHDSWWTSAPSSLVLLILSPSSWCWVWFRSHGSRPARRNSNPWLLLILLRWKFRRLLVLAHET